MFRPEKAREIRITYCSNSETKHLRVLVVTHYFHHLLECVKLWNKNFDVQIPLTITAVLARRLIGFRKGGGRV